MVDFIEDDNTEVEEQSYILDHKNKFKKEPVIIGIFWNNREALIKGIESAIKTGKPYNEYNLLSAEEREAYEAGDLLF